MVTTKQTKIQELSSQGKTPVEISELTGISRVYVYRFLARTITDNSTTTTTPQGSQVCGRCGIHFEGSGNLCKVCKPFGAIKEQPIQLKEVPTVTIGADPEFIFAKDGRQVCAFEILPSGTHRKVGTDGCSSTAEIRPMPGKDAGELTNNVKRLLRSVKKYIIKTGTRYEGVKCYAGSGYQSSTTGGHIHLGGFTRLDIKLTKVLDTISILLRDTDCSAARRIRMGRYGSLGDYRTQPWGLEYRTPYSWLKDPEHAKAVLALYHSVALEYKLNPNSTTIEQLSKFVPVTRGTKIHQKYSSTTANIKPTQKKILKVLTSMDVLRNNVYGYRDIVIPFIGKALETPCTTFHKIDFEKWGLNNVVVNPRRVSKFIFNSDEHLGEIEDQFTNPRIQEGQNNTQIYVYGIRDDRGVDVAYGPQTTQPVRDKLMEFAVANQLVVGEINDIRTGRNLVGFNLKLRTTQPQKVLEVLNSLKEVQ